MKKREKEQRKDLKLKQQRKSQIKEMEGGLKHLQESVYSEKMNEVRLMKAGLIKDEIQKISEKDKEARKLEKREDNLLKRLKETHALQQETLTQI